MPSNTSKHSEATISNKVLRARKGSSEGDVAARRGVGAPGGVGAVRTPTANRFPWSPLVYVCVCVCATHCVSVCVYMSVHASVYERVCVCMCLCARVCVCTRMCVWHSCVRQFVSGAVVKIHHWFPPWSFWVSRSASPMEDWKFRCR